MSHSPFFFCNLSQSAIIFPRTSFWPEFESRCRREPRWFIGWFFRFSCLKKKWPPVTENGVFSTLFIVALRVYWVFFFVFSCLKQWPYVAGKRGLTAFCVCERVKCCTIVGMSEANVSLLDVFFCQFFCSAFIFVVVLPSFFILAQVSGPSSLFLIVGFFWGGTFYGLLA